MKSVLENRKIKIEILYIICKSTNLGVSHNLVGDSKPSHIGIQHSPS